MAHLPRFALLALVISVNVGLGIYVTARCIAPHRFETPRARKWLIFSAVIAICGVMLIEIFARRFAPMGGGIWRPFVWAERVTVFTLFLSLIGIVLVQIILPIFFGVEREKPALPPNQTPLDSTTLTRREVASRALSTSVAAVASGSVLYGSLRERHDLQISDVTVTIPNLPPDLEGLTIVQLTDLHIGIFTGMRELDVMIEKTLRLRPDVVVITGDILDNNPKHISDGMRQLSRLKARFGTFSILGNHDHFTNPTLVAQGLNRAGLQCLVNRSVAIHGGNPHRGSITLTGVDDMMAPSLGTSTGPDLPKALLGVDHEAPVVLLAHNPQFFDEASDRVALQLSGHTHGGQINIAGIAKSILPYIAGRYTQRRSTLYVSRGIGITGAPVRLAAPPEIVRIGLTSRRT
jgi:uncharacterized protein